MLSRIAPARCGFFESESMKTLAELAEDYKSQADHIKSQIEAIPEHTDDYKLKHKRAVLWDMWSEAMENYYKLKNYYIK